MAAKKKQTPAELRAEADRIEAEQLKVYRLLDAARIPTCPECGGRSFKITTFTVVSQSALFVEDPDEKTTAEDIDWGYDYQGGDHTDQNQAAECNACGADAQEVLEYFGWTFYDEPKPLNANGPVIEQLRAWANTLEAEGASSVAGVIAGLREVALDLEKQNGE